MRRLFTIIGLLLLVTGCLPKHLLAEHHVQTIVIAESCEKDGYGDGKCKKEDLESMVEQACLIEAARKWKGGKECMREEGEPDAGE